jgi:hypothetical protein
VPAQQEGVAEDVQAQALHGVGDMVCRMAEVQQAASARLELWWQQWANADDSPSSLHKYACWFKHRGPLGSKQHYLYDLSMPRQLQRQLLLLRTFNLKLGVHLHKFSASASPLCRHCGSCEDELHVLHACPTYGVLRVVYGIPSTPDVGMFDTVGPWPIAQYVRACMKLPEQEHADEVSTDSEFDDGSGDESVDGYQDGSFAERAWHAQLHVQGLRQPVRLALTRLWQCSTVLRCLLVVLLIVWFVYLLPIWALDAYRVDVKI